MYICLKYDFHEFHGQICTKWSTKRANSVCTNLSMPGYKPLSC